MYVTYVLSDGREISIDVNDLCHAVERREVTIFTAFDKDDRPVKRESRIVKIDEAGPYIMIDDNEPVFLSDFDLEKTRKFKNRHKTGAQKALRSEVILDLITNHDQYVIGHPAYESKQFYAKSKPTSGPYSTIDSNSPALSLMGSNINLIPLKPEHMQQFIIVPVAIDVLADSILVGTSSKMTIEEYNATYQTPKLEMK